MSYMNEYWEQAMRQRQKEKAARYAERYGGEGQLAMDLGVIPFGGHSVGKSDWATAMAMAMASKYGTGIDPVTKDGNGSLTIDMDYESAERSVFSDALRERIKKQKQKLIKEQENMKTKKFYHTFEYENREVTLCLLVKEERQSQVDRLSGREATATIEVGYAVCVPEDSFSEKLAKRISSGRAESEKARLNEFSTRSNKEFAFDLGILNATARIFERRIKRGEVVIKGIR